MLCHCALIGILEELSLIHHPRWVTKSLLFSLIHSASIILSSISVTFGFFQTLIFGIILHANKSNIKFIIWNAGDGSNHFPPLSLLEAYLSHPCFALSQVDGYSLESNVCSQLCRHLYIYLRPEPCFAHVIGQNTCCPDLPS